MVYGRGKDGSVNRFASAHEAGLFGTTPISDGEATGIERPSMSNLMDPNTGLLRGTYKLTKGNDIGLNVNTSALEELRNRGLSKGPSSYANILTEKQGLEEQDAISKAVRNAVGSNSSAFSEMARRGGLSSGARERLALSGERAATEGKQGVLRQGMQDRLGITAADEDRKLGILQNLPGMELGLGQAKSNLDLANRQYGTDVDRMNIAGALSEVGRQDAFKMNEYQEKMKMYGAEKTAQAQANAGKK